MLRHEALDLGNELGLAPEREVRLDALLDGAEPELLQASDLGLCERLVCEVSERSPPPHRERFA